MLELHALPLFFTLEDWLPSPRTFVATLLTLLRFLLKLLFGELYQNAVSKQHLLLSHLVVIFLCNSYHIVDITGLSQFVYASLCVDCCLSIHINE